MPRVIPQNSLRFPVLTAHHAVVLMLWCAAFTAVPTTLPAQLRIDHVETRFLAALANLQERRFEDAAQTFDSIAALQPPHARSDPAAVLAGRAYLRAFQPGRAVTVERRFLLRSAQSPYRDQAYLVLGEALEKAGERRAALAAYAEAYAAADSAGLRAWCLDRCRAMLAAGPALRAAEIDSASLSPAAARVAFHLMGEQSAESGDTAEARRIYGRLQHGPTPAGLEAAHLRLTSFLGHAAGSWSVFLALPASLGDREQVSTLRDIRDGVLTAADLHAHSGGPRVEIEQFFFGNEDTLRRMMPRLQRDRKMLAILGGVFSDDAEIVARTASATTLPCLIPAATAEGLSEYANTIFQMNTPLRLRGRLLADYLDRSSHHGRVVVLAPLGTPARAIAEGFLGRARENGMEVAVVSWYTPGARDLKAQFRSVAGTVAPSDTNTALFLPAVRIDDVRRLLEDYRQTGLRCPILGAGDWNHPDVLDAVVPPGMAVDFESDEAVDTASTAFRAFRAAYASRTSRAVSKDAVFGFDALNMLLSCLDAGAETRADLAGMLRKTYDGLRGPVSFGNGQVNAAMTILRYKDGRLARQDVVTSP